MPDYNPTKLIVPRLGLGLALSLLTLVFNLNVSNMPAEHPIKAWLTMTLGNLFFIGIMYFKIGFDDNLAANFAIRTGLDPNDMNTPNRLCDSLFHLDSGLCLFLSGLCYSFSAVSVDFPGLWWTLGLIQIAIGAWCIGAILPEREFKNDKRTLQTLS